jgi:hypothetical protein
MSQFQVFNINNPLKVITVIDSHSKEAAAASARAMHPDFAVVEVLGKRGSSARESGVRPVSLREAALTLWDVQQAVMDAIFNDAPDAQDIQIHNDGTLLYKVGIETFQRSWTIGDKQVVTLGDPQKVEMVARPVEAQRQQLRKVSEALNPDASDTTWLRC